MPRDLAKLTSGLGAPAIQVFKQAGASRSHFGGDPHLPAGAPWPQRDGKRLGFLARLSLEEMRRAVQLDWLPARGALLFFYDIDGQPWGFDPKDRGSWAVLLVPELESAIEAPGTVPDKPSVAAANAGFRPIATLPSTEREAVARLQLDDVEIDSYLRLRGDLPGNESRHHVGGFPDNVQGDYMELEAQLASNGLYCGDQSGYEDPRAAGLEPGAADWRLLFQFDTDDELGVMWGDCGMLYFWVREQDARKGDFGNAWLVLQCS